MKLRSVLALSVILVVSFSFPSFVSGAFADRGELDQITQAIHQRNARWSAQRTSLSSLTRAEHKKLLGSKYPLFSFKERILPSTSSLLPASLDWRNYNGSSYVTLVKDQGDCGACWAFAVSAALESKVLITQNTPNIPLDLSEQVLTSCSNAGNCEAGYINLASDFLSNYGLPPEDFALFTASNGSCANGYPDWALRAYAIPGWFRVAPNIAAIKEALYGYGPLVALMAVNTDFFYYGSGIYSHVWGDLVGYHAALIVGYDDIDQAFTVKGSWGVDWAEAGYFRIAYGEMNTATAFGDWTIAYNPKIPSAFPTIDGMPRGTGESAESTIDPASTGSVTAAGQGSSIHRNGARQEATASSGNNDGSFSVSDRTATGTSPDRSVARTETAGTPVIEYPPALKANGSDKPQMLLNESQQLIASGGCGGPYSWAIARGSGTLSAVTGDSIIFTAPAANTYCQNTPTISLVDSCGQSVLLTIAVTQSNNPTEVAMKTWEDLNQCGCLLNLCNCYILKKQYNCQSNKITECRAGTQSNLANGGFSCAHCMEVYLWSNCGTEAAYARLVELGWEDVRSNVMKYHSCCPAMLMTGLEGIPGIWPPDPETNDIGGSCPNDPRSPNADWESAANIKSGNLHFSEHVAGLTLAYNSLDPYNGPLGKKWTHNYNLKLLIPVSSNAYLKLKTGDGNILPFSLSNGIYLPDAVSGDTTQIIKNLDASFTRTFKNGLIQHFDQAGRITSITDRNGNTTTLAYTSGGELARVTDPNGRVTTISSMYGKIVSISDADSRMYNLGYTDGLLTSISNPLGHTWQYTYDGNGLMQAKTDPAGNTITYEYYTNSWIKKSTTPDGSRKMVYTQPGVATITEKDGGLWTYRYDPALAVKTQKTDPLGNTIAYSFDQKRNLTSVVEPDGSATSYTHDANGNVTSVTSKDPQGAVVSLRSYEYNSLNLVTRSADPKGGVTSYGYDARGNLTSVAAPIGTTTFQYDTRGNVIAMTDPNGRTTGFTYDAQNNLTSITDPLGSVASFTYDAIGNRLTMTDPMGHLTRFVYNPFHQMIRMTDPKGNVTAFTYDFRGKILSATDASGRLTQYEYNYRGQLSRITDALNKLTQLSYGPASCGGGCSGAEKLTSLTDALSHITRYDYDPAGQLIRETDPSGRETNLSRDARGRLLTRTKPDGRTITYTYGAANRLTQKQYPGGSVTQYHYDANGNITYAGNASIAYNFTYDANNRLTGVSDSNNRTIQYQYDPAGNKTATITPEGRTIAYSYDAAGRLTAISASNVTFGFGYDANSRRTGLAMPNGTAAAYLYDNNGNLMRINHTGSGRTVLAEINYTYDPVDNRLTRMDTASPGSESAGAEAMTYGTANELLTLNTTTYGYDPSGNRTRKTETAGEMIYAYDDEQRLVRVETNEGTQVTTYTYDPFGRRIEKNVNGTVTRYLYDGEDILLEYDQTGAVVTRYIHGPGIDEPLAVERNGQLYYFHADGLGSIVALTDSVGSVVQSYRYDAFGNILNDTPAVVQPYTYTAREYDPETGLYFYRARYYDPKAGRFLQKDPISFVGGDVNLYAYASNNPLNLVDPSGLWNSDLHSGIGNEKYGTHKWAIDSGFTDVAARVIAIANSNADNYLNVIIAVGVPGRHFNTAVTNGDTRDRFAERDLLLAIQLYNRGDSCGAYKALGRGLHSIQDKVAHGDWPFLSKHPDWMDDPSVRPDALASTELLTKQYFRNFRSRIYP